MNSLLDVGFFSSLKTGFWFPVSFLDFARLLVLVLVLVLEHLTDRQTDRQNALPHTETTNGWRRGRADGNSMSMG
jgi:hypothetical protein